MCFVKLATDLKGKVLGLQSTVMNPEFGLARSRKWERLTISTLWRGHCGDSDQLPDILRTLPVVKSVPVVPVLVQCSHLHEGSDLI